MGLLCRAGNYPSNYDCTALRAMTGHEGDGAVILFVVSPTFKTLWRNPNFCCFPKALPLVVV